MAGDSAGGRAGARARGRPQLLLYVRCDDPRQRAARVVAEQDLPAARREDAEAPPHHFGPRENSRGRRKHQLHDDARVPQMARGPPGQDRGLLGGPPEVAQRRICSARRRAHADVRRRDENHRVRRRAGILGADLRGCHPGVPRRAREADLRLPDAVRRLRTPHQVRSLSRRLDRPAHHAGDARARRQPGVRRRPVRRRRRDVSRGRRLRSFSRRRAVRAETRRARRAVLRRGDAAVLDGLRGAAGRRPRRQRPHPPAVGDLRRGREALRHAQGQLRPSLCDVGGGRHARDGGLLLGAAR
mmetsp:Transcript_29904/g.89938  ORF Transcript_29904/g.89938 Transcript_29904/m.89938 type:complete len:300 (+) Transcript_29904:409-1308(+)